MKIYIDFDGTLYNSTLEYERLINIFKKYNIDKEYINSLKKEKFYQKQKSYDVLAERIIKDNNLSPNIQEEVNAMYDTGLVHQDVIPFLEKYQNKYELILLTMGNKNHQWKKINASKLDKYFKDVIIAEKDKSKLNIDYTNGIFIDNNPEELEKFYNSKANYLIRIKRDVDKYSKMPIKIENIPEFKDFEELLKSNYIEKIGENYE